MKRNEAIDRKNWMSSVDVGLIAFDEAKLIRHIHKIYDSFEPHREYKCKKVFIKCPQCGEIADGKIENTHPFGSYHGYCKKCDYHILESEFEEVKKR